MKISRILEKSERHPEAVHDAEKAISYEIPTFKSHSNLIHFAAKNHIGFYSAHSRIEFKEEISEYKSSKGAVQFPLDKIVPLELVEKIIVFRGELDEKELKSLKIIF